ncbi:DUF6020 family protein [Acidipropionibacterium acidipropionici]|uniref:DUF6020 family protein n=1 Tax=Acidipropionibacterium acidipropionici TaxID=1748 RepID=UPI000408E600|nr:DUF6020 family protein [Acidipropionibacterium acidipropionici]
MTASVRAVIVDRPRGIASLAVSAVLVALWWVVSRDVAPGVIQWCVMVVGWLLLSAAIRVSITIRRTAVWVTAAVLSAIIAMMRTLGDLFEPRREPPFRHTGLSAWWQFGVSWLIALPAVCLILSRLAGPRRVRTEPLQRRTAVGWWLGASAVMLAAWSPYLLAFWPGIVGRDSWSIIRMGTGELPLTNHHPVAYTAFVRICMRLGGDFTTGTLVYSLIQAVTFALGLGVCALWLRYRGGRWVAAIATAWWALDPSVAMWSVYMDKDVIFVLWMTLMALLLAEIGLRGWEFLTRGWILAAFLAGLVALCFIRNNGIYISAFIVAVMSLFLAPRLLRPRRHGRRWWALPVTGVAVLGVVFGIQGPGYARAGVRSSEFVESVSVPLQQLAWANRYGTLTRDEQDVLAHLLPLERIRDVYSPVGPDSIKFDGGGKSFNNPWLDSHKAEFLTTWAKAMPENPVGYGLAWFVLTGRYIDPGGRVVKIDPGTKRGAGPVVIHDEDRLSGLTHGLATRYRLTKVATLAGTTPVVDLPYRMTLIIWLVILAACSACLAGRPRGALSFLPLVGLVVTLLIAAPVLDYRYVAAAHVGLPVLLMAMWAGARGDSGISRSGHQAV